MEKPKFDFTKKIEDMTPEQMKERIKAGFEYEIPHKIVAIPFLGTDQIVSYEYPEMIGLCPATGYPDTYILTIEFVPDKLIPELKSLKFYLMDYMKLPISHEHLADKIYKDLHAVIKPQHMTVNLDTAVRGGIHTIITKDRL